jgi:hypothetical protein
VVRSSGVSRIGAATRMARSSSARSIPEGQL